MTIVSWRSRAISSPYPGPTRNGRSRIRPNGGPPPAPRWRRSAPRPRPPSLRSGPSACPGRCTAPPCWTAPTGCCAPPSCGTTPAPRPNAPELPPAVRTCRGSPATWPCPGSPRPSWPGWPGTSRDLFARVATVLLPKDYLRLLMTGAKVSDMSDAAGTLWLDVAGAGLVGAAAGGHRADPGAACPRLVEGSAAAGTLLPAVARAWGLPDGVVVAGGGGDNAASAVGIGAVRAGDGSLSRAPAGSCSWSPTASAPTPPPPSTPSATRCRTAGARSSVMLSAASSVLGDAPARRRKRSGAPGAGPRPVRGGAGQVADIPALPFRRAHPAQRRPGPGRLVRAEPRHRRGPPGLVGP